MQKLTCRGKIIVICSCLVLVGMPVRMASAAERVFMISTKVLTGSEYLGCEGRVSSGEHSLSTSMTETTSYEVEDLLLLSIDRGNCDSYVITETTYTKTGEYTDKTEASELSRTDVYIVPDRGVDAITQIEVVFWKQKPDRDHDGIADDQDNCPDTKNPDQQDRDQDRRGDVCDNCPDTPNPDQVDVNKNHIGDDCESQKKPEQTDERKFFQKPLNIGLVVGGVGIAALVATQLGGGSNDGSSDGSPTDGPPAIGDIPGSYQLNGTKIKETCTNSGYPGQMDNPGVQIGVSGNIVTIYSSAAINSMYDPKIGSFSGGGMSADGKTKESFNGKVVQNTSGITFAGDLMFDMYSGCLIVYDAKYFKPNK